MHGSATWHFWLIGFGLTLLLEAPWVLWLLRPCEPSGARRLALFLVANLLTHPLVWFFFPSLPVPRTASLLLSEAWAFGAEAYLYAQWATNPLPRRAWLTSVLANGASWGLGTLIVREAGSLLFR